MNLFGGWLMVITGGVTSVALKQRSIKLPGVAVRLMVIVLSRCRVTCFISPPTCWFSSLWVTTDTPFTMIVALEMRCVPFALPFTMHMR